MKTISISLYKRPDYTKILLDHLDRCYGIEQYVTVICCEPVNSEVIDLAKNFRPNKSYVIVNPKIYGCNWNIFQCLNIGFDNNDFHIHLEDDTIPGKDFLNYCEWCNKEYINDIDIFSVSGYVNVNNKTEHYHPYSENINLVHRRKWYTPWGWATWKNRWNDIKDELHKKLIQQPHKSWDCHLHNIVREKYEIFPAVSRIQNIGAEEGTYVYSSEWHNKNQYNNFWIESLQQYTNQFKE
jgi:hypothetical protein